MDSIRSGSNFCCGVIEIGSFDAIGRLSHEMRGKSPEQIIKSVIEETREDMETYDEEKDEHVPAPGALYHIWFKKPKLYDGSFDPKQQYEFNELREYVRTIPNVIHLGEHINPNTGNMIDGYFFKDA